MIVKLAITTIFVHILIFSSDVDKVHDIMDDIAEQHDISREITEAISNNVAFPNDIDEDELEKELEELEQVRYIVSVFLFNIFFLRVLAAWE